MTTITATEARADLDRLMDEAAQSHEPIRILDKRANAILLSEDDWSAIQETLYLLAVHGMRESIKQGLQKLVDECGERLEW